MDIRPFDPDHATDVTEDLAEDRPEENRLYRMPNGDVVKVKAFWVRREPSIPGTREVEIRASLCDEKGQALPDGAGGYLISEPHYVTPTPGAESLESQIDRARRRWALAHHTRTKFWEAGAPGVAVRPEATKET